jgi:DNA-binding NarL/FixJ family response regulator
VIGEAGTASAALARIPAVRPDVALLDVRLPDGDGVTVCREVRSRMPEVACLILTAYSDDQALLNSIMAGAAGYVLKQVRGSDLADAVRTVASGQSLLNPRAASKLMTRLRDKATGPDQLAGLTPHERNVLELIGGRPDQPADRQTAVHFREDGKDLRLNNVPQARPGAAHPSRRLRSPDVRPLRTTSFPR